jgi:putative membrane protein
VTERPVVDPPVADRPPQRLSPLTPVVRSFIVLVAAAMTVMRDVTSGDLGPTAIIFALLLAGGAVYGTASWLRTTFWIEADELRVDTGVISRQSRRIRIDRLQGIDIVQPFVARIFGLAELRMDVAGGSSREGSLAYLPLAEARRLKDLLLARRDELGEERAAVAGAPVPATPVVAERPLVRVPLKMLLVSVLLSGETLATAIIAVVLIAAFVGSGQWIGVSASVPVLLGYGFAAVRRVSVNYRFTVSETPAGMQVRRGLFELSAQTIAVARVQGVVITEPLLWRPLGWARLDVSIAGYGEAAEGQGPAPSTVLPVGERAVVHDLARHILRGPDHEAVEVRPVPSRARWAAPIAYRFMGVGTSEHLVVSREGWFNRRTHVAPQARVQSLRISQGPWQRRLGLADVHTDSPPGPTRVRARHRDAAEARRLFDVEVDMTAWARHRS